ncbi:putative ABC transporter transmembrane protein [Cellulomonas flavigena DSM 20109]|uniref:Putative ABC transporter transmembrane protein n=1 Tax=Cellulomonas flavigena (strain ATCC 482 / DSM 20109 / BCRC 11376 / JCM 18109 / NBRC 3775 / NCIMB 8073 / NRS 134) TaxID=446466 RepID=D5UKL1_CELFN|nr:ABC transporter permease subunit [Cellulomonas flavigena]ADG73829.1 putative ABC transporter transmembrane protein [Cellulomonas flavigena DSM 20109]
MSTATAPAAPSATAGARVTFPRVLHSEWLKLVSLRSTWWTLGIAFVLLAGLPVMLTAASGAVPELGSDAPAGSADAVSTVVNGGLQMGSLAIVVLAALVVTSEYTTGSIRSTLAAVPTRLPVLVAKLVTVVTVTFAVGVLASAVAFGVSGLIDGDVVPDFSAPEVTRVVLGGPLVLAGIAAFTFATGALLRNTAATIAVVMGLLLVVESIVNLVPWKAFEYVRPLLPFSAGSSVMATQEAIDASAEMFPRAFDTGPWGGYAILLGWVAVLFVAATVRLRARDA